MSGTVPPCTLKDISFSNECALSHFINSHSYKDKKRIFILLLGTLSTTELIVVFKPSSLLFTTDILYYVYECSNIVLLITFPFYMPHCTQDIGSEM
jgi:hypothetical protein